MSVEERQGHPYRGLAVVLSFILPGLGQIYNQEFGKGTGFIFGYLSSWMMAPIVIGWVLLPTVWIWSMIDAYYLAERTRASE